MDTNLLTAPPTAEPAASQVTGNSLAGLLARTGNDYQPYTEAWTARHRRDWTDPAPAAEPAASLSVIIPMRNRNALIGHVLDQVTASRNVELEIIVVDDASSDDSAFQAAAHPSRPTVVRLDRFHGSSVARNAGTALASHDTVVYLDADMIVMPGTLAEFASRAHDNLVLLGFRHHIPVAAWLAGPLAPSMPDAGHDPRMQTFTGPGLLPFHGEYLDRQHAFRLLDATRDLIDLGHGRHLFDWSLPRTVITAMVSMPRHAVIDTGGFHPGFAGLWGAEDAYLGAKLIAAGCNVAPVRPAVGFHLDTPDHPAETQMKHAGLARTVAFYRSLLAQPMPAGAAAWFHEHTTTILSSATIIRH